MIVNNIEEKYISALCHPIIRYNTCTPLTLMEHIWTTYDKITTSDLNANEERMYGFEIIGKTGLFNEDCKEWRKKAEDEQTFEILNIFSLLLTILAVKTTRQQGVPDTVLIQSKKLFITK